MTLQLRPTFSESWYRVQNLRPRLRPTAQISRQFYRGERWYVVRDPAGNQYHRLSDAAYAFVGLLDGSRTIAEAWELVGGQLADDAPTQPEVIQILSQLYAANLIETNVTPDAQVLLRRHKKQVAQKTKGRLMNLLFPRIPLWDPDNFLRRWMPLMRHFLSVPFGLIWLAVVTTAIVCILPAGDALKEAGLSTINLTANIENAVLLYTCFVGLKVIHELGHGFMCRRFGGEVHELGIMFLVLFPAPYVDASSAWGFPNKWHRVLVGAGGMIFELFVAAIACFIWIGVKDSGNELAAQLAYNVMLIAGVSTVLFNANPLLRYDGYYILSDLLEIPNLQHKSKEYTLGLVKRHVFRVKATQPLPPVGQRFWLFTYAVTSTVYRIFISFAIMLMLLFQLPEELMTIGLFMGLGAVATFFFVPIGKLFKYLTVEPELHRKRGRAIAFTLACAAVIVIGVGIIPFPVHVRANDAVVDALDRQMVRPDTAGIVTEVRVHDQQQVRKGDVLLVATNDDLSARIEELRSRVNVSELKVRGARQSDVASARYEEQELAAHQAELKELERQQERLTITAPMDGTLVAPEMEHMVGRWIQPGQEIAKIFTPDELIAYGVLDQRDFELLAHDQKGYEAEVRLVGRVERVLHPSEVTVLPAASSKLRSPALTVAGGGTQQNDPNDKTGTKSVMPQAELQLTLANPDGEYMPGQRAYVRVTMHKKQPLIWQGYRKLLQLILNVKAPGR